MRQLTTPVQACRSCSCLSTSKSATGRFPDALAEASVASDTTVFYPVNLLQPADVVGSLMLLPVFAVPSAALATFRQQETAKELVPMDDCLSPQHLKAAPQLGPYRDRSRSQLHSYCPRHLSLSSSPSLPWGCQPTSATAKVKLMEEKIYNHNPAIREALEQHLGPPSHYEQLKKQQRNQGSIMQSFEEEEEQRLHQASFVQSFAEEEQRMRQASLVQSFEEEEQRMRQASLVQSFEEEEQRMCHASLVQSFEEEEQRMRHASLVESFEEEERRRRHDYIMQSIEEEEKLNYEQVFRLCDYRHKKFRKELQQATFGQSPSVSGGQNTWDILPVTQSGSSGTAAGNGNGKRRKSAPVINTHEVMRGAACRGASVIMSTWAHDPADHQVVDGGQKEQLADNMGREVENPENLERLQQVDHIYQVQASFLFKKMQLQYKMSTRGEASEWAHCPNNQGFLC